MANFLRSIAPAVLVGTAAVTVVAAADDGASAALGSEGTSTAAGASAAVEPSTITPTPDYQADVDSDDDDDDESSARNTGSAQSSGSNSAGKSNAATSPAAPATGSCTTASEITGPVVRTEWGPVQVAATVSNGRVCAVRTIQTPTGDRKSVMINAKAVPVIEAQVLAAGGATFDGVSGATVTSDGYRASLQAILDQA